MATTPQNGFYYPTDADQINVANHIRDLALGVDGVIGAINTEVDQLRVDTIAGDASIVAQLARIPVSIPSVGISSGNIIGQQEIGSFTIPNDTVFRWWHFWWYLGVTGHISLGVIQQIIRNDAGVDISAGVVDGYSALIPMSMMLVGRLGHPANSGPISYHCWVDVQGTNANVNINGGIMFIGI